MKLIKNLSLSLIILFLLNLSSCKYEEGPGISLRTKKSRITGTWNLEKITEKNGNVITPNDDNQIKYFFDKSGRGDYLIEILGITTTEIINWEFTDSKKSIKITYENGNVGISEILRLTKNTLIVLTSDEDRWELDKQ